MTAPSIEFPSTTRVDVCAVDDVPPGEGVAALLPDGEQVAIFRTWAGAIHAVSNVDPFSGAAVLSRGIVGDAGGVDVVAGPLYKQRFALATGECLDDPAMTIRVYPVTVVEGRVHVARP